MFLVLFVDLSDPLITQKVISGFTSNIHPRCFSNNHLNLGDDPDHDPNAGPALRSN